MASKGRKRYVPPPEKRLEQLRDDEFKLLKDVAGSAVLVSGIEQAWCNVQKSRLELAQVHLDVAVRLTGGGIRGAIQPEKRSVISRAYYAMYCAARAGFSFHDRCDRDDHRKLPELIAKSNLGSQPERDRVVGALNRYRNLRNEADYSPYYPTPLGLDAKMAIRDATTVLSICNKWFRKTAENRECSYDNWSSGTLAYRGFSNPVRGSSLGLFSGRSRRLSGGSFQGSLQR